MSKKKQINKKNNNQKLKAKQIKKFEPIYIDSNININIKEEKGKKEIIKKGSAKRNFIV